MASSRSRPMPQFSSINLGQAVLLLGYEWFKAGDADARPNASTMARRSLPATREELFLLFEHLEEELEKGGFLFPPGNRPGMIRNLRTHPPSRPAHRPGGSHLEGRHRVALTKGKKARRNSPE